MDGAIHFCGPKCICGAPGSFECDECDAVCCDKCCSPCIAWRGIVDETGSLIGSEAIPDYHLCEFCLMSKRLPERPTPQPPRPDLIDRANRRRKPGKLPPLKLV